MLVWDVTCAYILTPSYTSMEVGVVLARQRMKSLKYQTIYTVHFFVSIITEISGVFWTEVTAFLLGSGKEYSGRYRGGRLKFTSPPEDLSCDTRE